MRDAKARHDQHLVGVVGCEGLFFAAVRKFVVFVRKWVEVLGNCLHNAVHCVFWGILPDSKFFFNIELSGFGGLGDLGIGEERGSVWQLTPQGMPYILGIFYFISPQVISVKW
jgi:hypothetical protein